MTLGDEQDTRLAIASTKEAFKQFSKTTKEERIGYLERMYDAMGKRTDELVAVMVQKYGGTLQFSRASVQMAIYSFANAIATLQKFDFVKTVGSSMVRLEPIGVAGIITPWNASNAFICGKLATAISAGCTVVIKPSEMSALQTQLLTEILHEAGLPPGLFNIVNGRGNVVDAEITRHRDIPARLSVHA